MSTIIFYKNYLSFILRQLLFLDFPELKILALLNEYYSILRIAGRKQLITSSSNLLPEPKTRAATLDDVTRCFLPE